MKKISIVKNIIMVFGLLFYLFIIFYKNNQYIYNINYLKCIIFMLLISFIIYCYGIIIDKEKVYKSNINNYILLFAILLITIVFILGRTKIRFYNWTYYMELRPFYTIVSEFKYASFKTLFKNIMGNFCMLIPLSILLIIKDKKYYNILRQIIVIFMVSLGIELIQAYTHVGSFDIDDIILNTLGSIIITLILTKFSIIKKIKSIFYKSFSTSDDLKYKLFYLSIIVFLINCCLILM